MSMNFNNSNQPPTEPKPRKSNVKLAVGVTLGIIGAAAFLWYIIGVVNTINANVSSYSSANYETPTLTEITQKCAEKIKELFEMEPTQYMIDVCVKGANYVMNDPNPLSANPTVQEITQKCTEILRNELQSEPPKLEVNMCVGTWLGEMNKSRGGD